MFYNDFLTAEITLFGDISWKSKPDSLPDKVLSVSKRDNCSELIGKKGNFSPIPTTGFIIGIGVGTRTLVSVSYTHLTLPTKA